MTKEEALSKVKGYLTDLFPSEEYDEAEEIIKALEQEPCDDAISRQSAIFLASDLKQDLPDDEHIADMVMAHNEGILEYQTQLSLLPSATPQPKIGHWIVEVWNNKEHHTCSSCQHVVDYEPCYHYCPYCGAKMVEPQESEG